MTQLLMMHMCPLRGMPSHPRRGSPSCLNLLKEPVAGRDRGHLNTNYGPMLRSDNLNHSIVVRAQVIYSSEPILSLVGQQP